MLKPGDFERAPKIEPRRVKNPVPGHVVTPVKSYNNIDYPDTAPKVGAPVESMLI